METEQKQEQQQMTVNSHPFSLSLIPKNYAEAVQLAQVLSKSDLVPKEFRGNASNCLIAIGMGMEVGIPPLQAIQNIAPINGRPTMWGDACLALVKNHPKFEWVIEEINPDGLSATCKIKRKNEPEVFRTFTIEQAKRAQLTSKDNWTKYPQRMLQMRARSWALRDSFPDALKGIGIREEVEDYNIVDVTPTATVSDVLGNTGQRIETAKAEFKKLGVPENKFMDYLAGVSSDTDEDLLQHLTNLYKGVKNDKAMLDSVFNLNPVGEVKSADIFDRGKNE